MIDVVTGSTLEAPWRYFWAHDNGDVIVVLVIVPSMERSQLLIMKTLLGVRGISESLQGISAPLEAARLLG